LKQLKVRKYAFIPLQNNYKDATYRLNIHPNNQNQILQKQLKKQKKKKTAKTVAALS